MPTEEETYLGFDLSTQKLKAVQLSKDLQTLVYAEVKFDKDLYEFQTFGGVHAGDETHEFYVRPIMWVKALDMVLDRLVVQGANLSTVVALSGSAQQHGSVYWTQQGIDTLNQLDADKFLHVQLNESAFSLNRTPIWMDGSTEKQCADMEDAVGGREKMVEISGSKCYPRFTGPQIRKIYETKPDVYENTVRISLVSSFLASIFIGHVAPIDMADGSGMNLLDIRSKKWSEACLNACAPDLERRLGEPVKTCSVIGNVCSFFVQRYGFKNTCKVTGFTGDNPSALCGMLVHKELLAVSLGTSDTIMMTLTQPSLLQEGHILRHPVEDAFMGLLCFRNGSLVRDVFKRADANNNWDCFSEMLDSTPRGNGGNMALHFHSVEIIPSVEGTLRWGPEHSLNCSDASVGLAKFNSPAVEIRALVEGQMLHRKAIAADMGFTFGENTKIVATGGASANKSILQVVADVFNAPVYIQKTTEAALLGSAYRAKFTLHITSTGVNPSEDYYEYIAQFLPHNLHRVCDPAKDSEDDYLPMLPRFRDMVKALQTRKKTMNVYGF